MGKAIENLELDPPMWTKESFLEALSETEYNEEEWGDPLTTMASHDSGYRDQDIAVEYEGSWVTVGSVVTESSDRFLYSRPGKLSRRELAIELFLSDVDYFGSLDGFYFDDLKYISLSG